MSDDEGDNAIRRSPRKGADGGPVMTADAARNIIRNKKEPNVMLQTKLQEDQKPETGKNQRQLP